MTKFHINSKGVPSLCKAKLGNCPFGGDESHFDNKQNAQVYADNLNAKEHGIIPGLKSSKLTKKQVNKLFDSISSKDRIRAIDNGFDNYTILKDPSDEVRMAAANKGLMSESLMYDDNIEIAKVAKEKYYNTTPGRLDILYDELVPASGKANSVAGELIRATARLNYRLYNDGDRIGVDYGNETCNSSARYLIEELERTEAGKKASRKLINLWGKDSIPANEYEAKLKDITEDIIKFIEFNPSFKEMNNNKDSIKDYSDPSDYEYDEEYDDEYDDDYYDEDWEYNTSFEYDEDNNL